eukprot:5063518-Prymnesium_polylepis.1
MLGLQAGMLVPETEWKAGSVHPLPPAPRVPCPPKRLLPTRLRVDLGLPDVAYPRHRWSARPRPRGDRGYGDGGEDLAKLQDLHTPAKHGGERLV